MIKSFLKELDICQDTLQDLELGQLELVRKLAVMREKLNSLRHAICRSGETHLNKQEVSMNRLRVLGTTQSLTSLFGSGDEGTDYSSSKEQDYSTILQRLELMVYALETLKTVLGISICLQIVIFVLLLGLTVTKFF